MTEADNKNENEMQEEEVTKNIPSASMGFDPSKKKKKKKPVAIDLPELEGLTVSSDPQSSSAGLKKKNLAQSNLNDENEITEGMEDTIREEEGQGAVLPQYPWEGSDRDYTFQELLDQVFDGLRENNPEMLGDRRRIVMKSPEVLRGTNTTILVNFKDLCKAMHRQPSHVMAFLLAELGTSGSLNGQERLVVKGRFAPKNFEGILRRYNTEYVTCNGCKSQNTTLSRENRLYFLKCEQCGSGRSVSQIQAGFVARVGRRKAET